MNHQWIAYVFYSQETINDVMYDNRVDEIVEDTDTNAIVVGISKENDFYNDRRISCADRVFRLFIHRGCHRTDRSSAVVLYFQHHNIYAVVVSY